jgi:hypothetical protein
MHPTAQLVVALFACAAGPAVTGHQDAALTFTAIGVVLALLRGVPGESRATEGAPPGITGEGRR